VTRNIEKPYNEKHRQITRTGKDLFFRFGIKRVTVEEICKEANVSKMTFYKHFRNKSELVKGIINLIVSEGLEQYRKVMNNPDTSFEEKVRLTIKMKMDGTGEIGDEFLDEYIIHHDPELAEFIHEQMNRVLNEVLNDYIKAQKRGEIRSDMKPEFILYFLNHIFELLKDKQLLMLYEHPREAVMELVNFFFYGIMNRK
jgi:AcrR family transcriptional regulator